VKSERDTVNRKRFNRSWNATGLLGVFFILSGLAGLTLLAWLVKGCP
jgi:hypothetical protein